MIGVNKARTLYWKNESFRFWQFWIDSADLVKLCLMFPKHIIVFPNIIWTTVVVQYDKKNAIHLHK